MRSGRMSSLSLENAPCKGGVGGRTDKIFRITPTTQQSTTQSVSSTTYLTYGTHVKRGGISPPLTRESSTPPLLKPKRLCIASTRELVEGIHYLAKTPCSDEKGQSMFCAIGFASAHSTSISRAALLEAAAVDSSPLGTSSL